MKLVSNLFDDIQLYENEYHALCFASTKLQQQFRYQILRKFQSKRIDDYHYVNILDESNREVKPKDIEFLLFDCHNMVLTDEKDTKATIQKMLFHLLETNSHFVSSLNDFNTTAETFIQDLEMNYEGISIDFVLSKKSMENFIKSLDLTISFHDNEYVPNYILRDFLIKLILQMNLEEKQVILLVMYPESDIGMDDFEKVIQMLKDLKVTVLVLTTEEKFIVNTDLRNINLIKSCGRIYDINRLKEELTAFNMFNTQSINMMTKKVGFLDFKEDYILMNDYLREFLMSNRL